MKTISILLGFLIFSFNVAMDTNNISTGQKGTLKGKVTDQETGKPINSAYVTVIKEKLYITSTHSGSDGTFIIKSLRPGKYSVKVEDGVGKKGYLYDQKGDRKKMGPEDFADLGI